MLGFDKSRPHIGAFICKNFNNYGLICGTSLLEGPWQQSEYVSKLKRPWIKSHPNRRQYPLTNYLAPGFQKVFIKKFIIHPLFDPSKFESKTYPNSHDISIVKLERLLTFNKNVGRACLPQTYLKPPILAYVSGWGFTQIIYNPIHNTTVKISSNILQFLDIPIMKNRQCKTIIRSSLITSRMICAGYPVGYAGESTCNGDSGEIHTVWQYGFENWGIIIESCRKDQNLTKIWLSKSIFYVKNYPNLTFFSYWRISI